ncbi:MAG: hypothetical protein Q9214_000123 [Letrouitia sp. 1 TL-2023]
MDEAAGSSNPPPPTRQLAATTTINSAPNGPSTKGIALTSYFSERSQHGYPPTTDSVPPQTHAYFNLFASNRASQTTLTLPRRTTAPSRLHNPTGAQKDLGLSTPVPDSILKKRTYQESVATSAGDGSTANGPGDHDLTPSLHANRHIRGQPRVRFHPSAGCRGGQLHRSQSSRAIPIPSDGTSQAILHHQSPFLASSPGARAAIPGSTAVDTSTPSSCTEKPEYFPRPWPAVSFLAKDRVRRTGADHFAQHSGIVKPCENADKHETPCHVCTACHARATNDIHRMNPGLFAPKWLPLCKPCGSAAVSSLLAERARQGLINPLMGCRCDYAHLCCECRISQMEVAMARYQAEAEMRMRIAVVGYVDDADNKCARWIMGCFCGSSLQKGDYSLLRCSGCQGLKTCT